ncbi:MBOAT family protein [Candidatus Woesearchaeota archaeon]|nr:MBOAT family protein [Candidatus Woesearchaeota archaeon]
MEWSLIFNSINFLVFFPVVATLYYLLPGKFQWQYLLLASFVFYISFVPVYVLVLLLIITLDYFAAIAIEAKRGKHRTFLFISTILANCSVIFFFKYFDFIGSNLNLLAESIGWNYSVNTLSLILPIGISFYIFQSLGYIIEVYRGNHNAERHYGIYALYIMFFPQIVAGPIGRPQALLPQFHKLKFFNLEAVKEGALLMLWGFFKKVVIADQISDYVVLVYNAPGMYSGSELFFATVLFGIQIYNDFSGYTDIARGAAQVLGFSLAENFKMPYFSKSISEFWQRWHISLMSWFRDYIYIPLGGNRVSSVRWGINVAVVFLISGLWHGANWTFVIWGLLHAVYIIASRITEPIRNRLTATKSISRNDALHHVLQITTTFLLVNLAWIFFRAKSIGEGFFILHSILTYFSSSAGLKGLLNFLYVLVPFLFFTYIYNQKDIYSSRSGYPLAKKGVIIICVLLLLFWGTFVLASNVLYLVLFFGAALVLDNTNVFAGVPKFMQWFGYFCITLTLALFLNLVSLNLINPLVKVHILIALFGFCIAELVHFLQEHPTAFPLSKKTTLVRWAVYISLISAILVFGIFEKQQFIYIQF